MAGTITASIVKNDTTSPPTFQNSAGTEIGTLCRAWAKFTGSTGALVGSFNVSSITRNTTGDYTVNFTNSMPDANYSAFTSYSTTTQTNPGTFSAPYSYATGSVRITAGTTSGGAADSAAQSISVFR